MAKERLDAVNVEAFKKWQEATTMLPTNTNTLSSSKNTTSAELHIDGGVAVEPAGKRAAFCLGTRRPPIAVNKSPNARGTWARRYGLGKCPECLLWFALHADGTLVQHNERLVGRWL